MKKYFEENKLEGGSQIICQNCNISFERKKNKNGRLSKAKYCSEKCMGEQTYPKLKEMALQRIAEGTHQGWKRRDIESYPEKFFKKVLSNYGIPFEFNKPIKKRDLGVDCDSCYFLDFFIPDANIDLEIDGKQHEYAERAEMDILRDSLLSQVCKVYRIKWRSIKT